MSISIYMYKYVCKYIYNSYFNLKPNSDPKSSTSKCLSLSGVGHWDTVSPQPWYLSTQLQLYWLQKHTLCIPYLCHVKETAFVFPLKFGSVLQV